MVMSVDGRMLERVEIDGEHNDQEALFDFDLRSVVHILRRNLLWVVGMVAAAIIVGVLFTLLAQPKYMGTARVLIENEAAQLLENTNLQPEANSVADTERFLQTQVEMIKSRALAQDVVESEKLANDENFFESYGEKIPDSSALEPDAKSNDTNALDKLRKKAAVTLLLNNLEVTLPKDSRIVEINYQATRPGFAAKIANAFADAYVASNLRRKYDASLGARKFLAQQLDDARSKLEKSQQDLNAYLRRAGLIRTGEGGSSPGANVDGTLSTTNNSLVQLSAGANQATTERIAAEQAWNAVAKAPLLTIPQVLQNSAVQQMLQQKANVEAKLADELARHQETYPTVRSLRAESAEIDKRLNLVAKSIRDSIKLNYESAREREQALQSQVADVRDQALSEQDRSVQYNILLRIANTNRSLYDALLQRYNSLNATAGSSANNVSIIDSAIAPDHPYSPSLILNLAIALVAGLVLAVAVIFMREHFDTQIRDPGDVARKLSLPLLGLIPNVSEDEIGGDKELVSKSPLSEAYQSLVATLRYSSAEGFPRSLLVTSSGQSEGKSTSSSAIAAKIAQLGLKVVLVDCDLRRPTLHRKFERGSSTQSGGLTDVIVGEISLDAALKDSGIENLSCLTALPMPPDPSALLGSQRLRAVLEDLKQRFDVVILDSPPVLGLADAIELASVADSVLLVVDGGNFNRGVTRSALRRLEVVKAKLVGVVVTKFDPKGSNDYTYYGTSYYNYG